MSAIVCGVNIRTSSHSSRLISKQVESTAGLPQHELTAPNLALEDANISGASSTQRGDDLTSTRKRYSCCLSLANFSPITLH